MTIKRVREAAYIRGIYFDGEKRFLNCCVGYGYEVMTGKGFFQADTLEGIYKYLMTFPKIKKG